MSNIVGGNILELETERREKKGRIEGKIEGKEEVAINLIKEKESDDRIQRLTKLSMSRIKELRNNL